jgi:hypothetical protein
VSLADDILCGIDPEVLLLISGGDEHTKLAQSYDDSKDRGTTLAQRLDSFKERAEEHLSIYICMFCEKATNKPLDWMFASSLAAHVKAYAKQDATHNLIACKINKVYDKKNQWTQQKSDNGERLYLQTAGKAIADARVKNMLVFADKLEEQVNACKESKQMYMPFMQYVGYAIKASTRLHQHESHSSTNFLCMFVQALSEVLWPQVYHMRTFTICLIPEEWGGPVAETLLTRVGRAYYHTGGFSIDQAGKSMKSILMQKLSVQERTQVWGDCLEWISKNTPYDENIELEIERRRKMQLRKHREHLLELAEKEKEFPAMVTEQERLYAEMTKIVDLEYLKEYHPDLYQGVLEAKADLSEVHRELEKFEALGPVPPLPPSNDNV